ncbi:hypothetical protein MUG78_17775 [Gordonia alkaliphila]|uniref:hypothetical protein n=1 Tax=Gordonia alkaliphila TaxID=1053547 RepID=UPI001FF4F7C8|nr:hypothetical protein [Gordonia alkaliphila]MCK0441251.1 hypothetical protein [Gordonia alkaliphila]
MSSTFTRDQVSNAINVSANQIIAAADLAEEGTVDALNLLVNATLHMLDHNPDGDAGNLEQAVADSYSDASLSEVLSWIR